MRKDQPKLNKELKDLRSAVKSLQSIIFHRDNIIETQCIQLANFDEEDMIASIEYERLMLGKPALTKAYWFRRLNITHDNTLCSE